MCEWNTVGYKIRHNNVVKMFNELTRQKYILFLKLLLKNVHTIYYIH